MEELTYLAYQLRILALEKMLIQKGIATKEEFDSMYEDLIEIAHEYGSISFEEIDNLRHLLNINNVN